MNPANDSLQALEQFWDCIHHAFNTICTKNQVFPYYKDLKKDFDVKFNLCSNSCLKPSKIIQVKKNYRSFGETLHLYLLTPSTVSQATCSKAFLRLFSLKGSKDSTEPQLEGIVLI